MEVTGSFQQLLGGFQCVFTTPSYQTFVCLMVGWVLSHRRRFVTELILSSGCQRTGHHSRYHRFFSHSAWLLDELCQVLAVLLIGLFAPAGIIELAVDDTLCRKRGLTLFGAGMHHDPLISSRALKLVSWGHDWVVLGLVVRCGWAASKVWCLPIGFRLYRNRQGLTKGAQKNRRKPGGKRTKYPPNAEHRTRPQLALELLQLLACWFPDRTFVVSGDSLYGGASVLRHLPSNMHLVSRVHFGGRLYQPAPEPAPGQRGRRRHKGAALPGMAAWADDASQPWQKLVFDQFGLHATLLVKTMRALYYTAGKDRLLTIVLVRDAVGQRPDQMFYCTLLEWDARQILSAYASRWAIEVTFENGKQLMGLEDPANRTVQAVQRTAPMALVLYSLVVAWFHRVGHKHVRFPDRPWYKKKQEPSFGDMLSTLRRMSWQEKFRGVLSGSTLRKKVVVLLIEFASRSG